MTSPFIAIAAAVAVLTGIGAAIGIGIATKAAVEAVARQPEADGKIRTALMLGLFFVEADIIYALIVGILIIFVL